METKAKRKKTKSELLRLALLNLWTVCYHEGIEFEEFYNVRMDSYIKSIQQITERIEIDKIDDFYTHEKNTK